jgi:hypothetical protein
MRQRSRWSESVSGAVLAMSASVFASAAWAGQTDAWSETLWLRWSTFGQSAQVIDLAGDRSRTLDIDRFDSCLAPVTDRRGTEWIFAIRGQHGSVELVRWPLDDPSATEVLLSLPRGGEEGLVQGALAAAGDGVEFVVEVWPPLPPAPADARHIHGLCVDEPACRFEVRRWTPGEGQRTLLVRRSEPTGWPERADGTRVIVDAEGAVAWPSGEKLLYTRAQPPPRWMRGPPPTVEAVARGTVALSDGSFLQAAARGDVVHVRGGRADRPFPARHGLRWPADGDAGTAAIEGLHSLQRVGSRLLAWELGDQRLFELVPPAGGAGWRYRTLWTAPQAAPAEAAETPFPTASGVPLAWLHRRPADPDPALLADPLQLLGRPDAPYAAQVYAHTILSRTSRVPTRATRPTSVEAIVARWEADPLWDSGAGVAVFLAQEPPDTLAVLERDRGEAVRRLVASDTPAAALALAALGATEARPELEALLKTIGDATRVHSENADIGSWCDFPSATFARAALEHLEGKPLRQVVGWSPEAVAPTLAERESCGRDAWVAQLRAWLAE